MEPATRRVRLTSMKGSWLRTCALMLAGLVAASLAGCASAAAPGAVPTAERSQRIASLMDPTASFLTVTTSFDVTRRDGLATKLVKYGVATLQVRSARTGRVIATLLHSLGSIDAVPTADGSVLAVVNLGCRSQVTRIDPLTGQATLIRSLSGSAWQAAVSPDGRELAYLTYPANQPQPCAPSRQPAEPIQQGLPSNGPALILSVLVIVNLSSGATLRISTGATYNSLESPTWNPDGTRIAVNYGQHSIEELSPNHPEFALPPPIRAAKGCFYGSDAWTVTGLVVVSGCGSPQTGPVPQRLLGLSTAGQQTGSWQLPDCLDGAQVHADPTGTHVLVEMDIGYGNFPPCGDPKHPGVRAIRVGQVRGKQLGLIAVYPPTDDEFDVPGW
jgi:hypothetical protein